MNPRKTIVRILTAVALAASVAATSAPLLQAGHAVPAYLYAIQRTHVYGGNATTTGVNIIVPHVMQP